MRFRWILAAAAVMIAAFPTTARAGDGWRLVEMAGVVRVSGAGYMPIALTREQELPPEAWVETAAGRAVLVRDQETVIVAPNSRIQLPSEPVDGNTQVLQTLGSALYKIGKQKKPHFQVDTPYLAAIVKGTAFTVTVNDDQASVAVTEGLVEVSTPGQEDVQFVRPGFTALVSRMNGRQINIGRSPVETNTQSPQTEPGSPNGEREATTAVLIPAAIGEVAINVGNVSNGLIDNDLIAIDLLPNGDGGALLSVKNGDIAVETPVIDLSVGGALGPVGPLDVGSVGTGAVGATVGVVDNVVDTINSIRIGDLLFRH